MAVTGSRRDMLHFGCGTAAVLGIAAAADALGPVRAIAQGASSRNEPTEDFFYRFGLLAPPSPASAPMGSLFR